MIIDRPAAATADAAAGPILYARGGDEEQHLLAALLVLPEGAAAPELAPEDSAAAVPIVLANCFGKTVWRYDFSLPADRSASYRLGDQHFTVAAPAASDRRIVYVSCNGQESGDLDREDGERDAMWTRLAAEHRRAPFALMLQGGDQLYADDVLYAHPSVERWASAPRDTRGDIAFEPAADKAVRRFYFERYLGNFGRAAMRTVAAEIPSVMMWDDHDIIDGWGSHPAALLDSPVGRGLFAAARDMFLLFQVAATDATLPSTIMDRSGATLGLVLRYPDLALLAPDLRSERRPDRVMGPQGWAHFEAALAATPPWDRVLLMSSVPAIGPRLSWLEALADMLPGRNKYEDDMRDQWQSRVHRDEWVRLLSLLAERQEYADQPVTLVSGEIHLATRGEMLLADESLLHQLVASGISHPAPSWAYPTMLELLAQWGESPLPGYPIQLRPLPGQRRTYAAERNYLVLSFDDEALEAEWELERSGRTPPLPI
ncbi:alkaline phosphatase D family protein [Aurantimonas endophytica]|uniref:PhoD-like phosphatase domain-containing protein n=1 Tax=Aurantimonas endophytica TaxID=1522175 RepID=A0A7W6MQ96_9HYPH|nr:alkaline phosphatase D family protein [Aurantimonas endophytica]MBB4003709.1 hypothetical protein [Aurantimonas endophytica]MCO6404565.1 alkaline phosphatase family protein [Aurantimonas endophytica]